MLGNFGGRVGSASNLVALLNTCTQVIIIHGPQGAGLLVQLMGFEQGCHQEKEASMNLWVGPLGQVTLLLLHLHLNV